MRNICNTHTLNSAHMILHSSGGDSPRSKTWGVVGISAGSTVTPPKLLRTSTVRSNVSMITLCSAPSASDVQKIARGIPIRILFSEINVADKALK